MKFSYYKRLSTVDKKIYDRSDAITHVKLPGAERFGLALKALENGLLIDDITRVQGAAQRIIGGLCTVFNIPKIRVRVLTKRPSKGWGEMHGLYEAEESGRTVITVWMRTAQKKQAVAFKTFLRTIIHEFMHHLDFRYLRLADSFHTQGFYKRESSLVSCLLKA